MKRIVWNGYEGSDWIAIYNEDGSKHFEGHPPDTMETLELFGIDFDSVVGSVVDHEVRGRIRQRFPSTDPT